MSRKKELLAAGRTILSHIKPAYIAQAGQVPHALRVGPYALSLMVPVLMAILPMMPKDGVWSSKNSGSLSLAAMESVPAQKYTGDAALFHQAYRLQDKGLFAAAAAVTAEIHDAGYKGHLEAQKLLHPSYKASFAELRGWLNTYKDLPQSAQIARLAARRAPAGVDLPDYQDEKGTRSRQNLKSYDALDSKVRSYRSTIRRTTAQEGLAQGLIQTVRRHVDTYEPSAALRALNDSKASLYLDRVEKDRLRAMAASGYLYAGKIDKAEELSRDVLKYSGEKAPLAGWVQGLAQWQLKNYKTAAKAFELTALSPYANGWMASGAAYWAARAHAMAGSQWRKTDWLKIAAKHPRTFYGLLAIAALEGERTLDWNTPALTRAQESMVLDTGAGQRADKMLEAGEPALAEMELRALFIAHEDEDFREAVLAFAYARKLPALTLKLAYAMRTNGDDRVDTALYPTMPWAPEKGYRIDRALIHAIVRQESRFNPDAENRSSGAAGLMQLMPRTAYHVAGDEKYLSQEGRESLKSPEVSLSLGQKYVEELLNNRQVGQDLLSLAIAYNAGPGTLAKWKAERADMHDPLLFIETIPFAETRHYVEQVMANYWMYRLRFDQKVDSMVALSQGKWARYASQDSDTAVYTASR